MALKKIGPYKKYPAIIIEDSGITRCGVAQIQNERESVKGKIVTVQRNYYVDVDYHDAGRQIQFVFDSQECASWYIEEIWKLIQPRAVEHPPSTPDL